MNRLGSCSMHPLLLLITLVLLATSAVSTEQSNLTKLRPERILENPDPIYCNDNYCYQASNFKGNKATYSILLQTGSKSGLAIYPDDEKRDLTIYLESNASTAIFCYIYAYPSHGGPTKSYEQSFFFQQQQTPTTVSGPTSNVMMIFENEVGNPKANITVTITQPGNGHNTSKWVIPVSVSIGVLIVVVTVVVLCYYRQKRRNRQRRNDQPASLNEQPIQEENPSKTQAIIDTFPEARFEQFESSFPQKTCTICVEDMQKEQICRQLDCQHIFHTECGKLWLENQFEKMKKAFCPNCNEQVNILNPKKCPKIQERRVK